jgi:drug/metabolite transporter (DMT)-like permease
VDTPQPEHRSDNPNPRALAGALLVLAAALAFSTKAILVKVTYAAAPGIDAVTIMAARMAFGLPCFLGLALWAARRGGTGPRTTGRERLALVVLGLLGYYAASLMDTAGLRYISAGTERLILFVYPTLVVLIGAVFLRERLRASTVAALAATYAGVALAIGAGAPTESRDLALGSVLVFGAALSFAVFIAGGTPLIRRLGAMRFTAWTMTVASGATALHYLVLHGPALAGLPPKALGLCLVMALVSTTVPALLMAEGIRRIGAGRAAVIGTVGPVATIGMDHLWLGQAFGTTQMAGTALVLAGVLAAGRGGRG